MVKKILFAVVGVVVLFGAYVATRPSAYRIERSAPVAAPPEVVYAQIADFHRWKDWSPWAHLDPKMRDTLGGAPAGLGAVYEWSGNDKVGEGRMTIVGARPNEEVDIRLEFLKPWSQTSRTEFRLKPEAGGTRVTWAMSGENDFVGKAYGVFVDMDRIVGRDFEKGLASLRTVSEDASAKAQRPPEAPPAR
ncbi:MAG TPA: SRPBCC family protein [Anaeromyxobacteraceae bacterium]|nr:SRPBCC family protein [Anaeromyxobacteraceae bacterium]